MPVHESTTCTLCTAKGGGPHGIRQAHQHEEPLAKQQQFERYAVVARLTWCLPLAFKTSSFAPPGSIPTEFGKLINLTYLGLHSNQLTGAPRLLMLPGSTSLPLALKPSSFAPPGSIPTEFGKLINLTYLGLEENQLSGTPSLLILSGSTSLPLALKTSSFALAGSIPKEFGKLINMKKLFLTNNQLSGTPPFAHIALFGSTIHVAGGGGGGGSAHIALFGSTIHVAGGGGGGGSARGGASGVASHGALSVSYPPGAQVQRGSRCS